MCTWSDVVSRIVQAALTGGAGPDQDGSNDGPGEEGTTEPRRRNIGSSEEPDRNEGWGPLEDPAFERFRSRLRAYGA